jgi:hypothetical protein
MPSLVPVARLKKGDARPGVRVGPLVNCEMLIRRASIAQLLGVDMNVESCSILHVNEHNSVYQLAGITRGLGSRFKGLLWRVWEFGSFRLLPILGLCWVIW